MGGSVIVLSAAEVAVVDAAGHCVDAPVHNAQAQVCMLLLQELGLK